LLASKEDLIRC